MSAHKNDFKGGKGSASVDDNRKARHLQANALRKQHREKSFAVKRMQVDDDEDEDALGEGAISQEQMAELVHNLRHSHSDTISNLLLLKKWLSLGSQCVEFFLNVPGSMDILLNFLSKPTGQAEACECVANIAAGVSQHAQVALAATPYLITILSSTSTTTQEKCLWALGNICGDGPHCRDVIMAQGVVSPLLHLLQRDESNIVEAASFLSSNLARGQGANIEFLVSSGLISALMQALSKHHENDRVVCEICFTFSYLTAGREEICEILVSESFIPLALTLFQNYLQRSLVDNPATIPLIRVFGNILCGKNEIVDNVIADGVLLTAFLSCLTCAARHIQLETAWALSCLTGGTSSQSQKVIDFGFLPHLISMLFASLDFKREAGYCILNISSHGIDQLNVVIDANAPAGFHELLRCPDTELIDIALMFFEMLLRISPQGARIIADIDVAETIDNLTFHSNPTIRSHSTELIEKFYSLHGDIGNDNDD